MLRRRGLLGVLCVVVILAIAMAPLVSSSVGAILVLLAPLFGGVVSTPLDIIVASDLRPSAEPLLLASRAPPAA